MFPPRFRPLVAAAFLLAVCPPWSGLADAADRESRARELVRLLGNSEYSTRERAQAELKRIGLDAFEPVYEATFDEDLEVARRARYLLRSIAIPWTVETDAPEVRIILRNYGDQPAIDRRSRLDRLAMLAEGIGFEPLCRLAKFETDPILSKHAARLLMAIEVPSDRVPLLSAKIRDTMQQSQRPAAKWLRLYAETMANPEAKLADWDQVIRQELVIYSQYPDQTDYQVVRDLLRWQADLLRLLKRTAESDAVVRRSFDLVRGDMEDLIDTAGWLLYRKLWPLVEELAARFDNRFNDSLELLYMLAESQLRQSKPELANQTADHARALEATAYAHERQAELLRDRGFFDWAEKEFRRVFDLVPIGDSQDVTSRMRLAEMLHDQDRDQAAGEVLKDLFDAIDKDKNLKEVFSKKDEGSNALLARMHYFFAMHHGRLGSYPEQRKHLEQAIGFYAAELDVLIAMYRFPNADDEWKKRTSQLIAATSGNLLQRISQQERELAQIPVGPDTTSNRAQLAQNCNEYAWLIANTEGDYATALRMSKRSLELMPASAAYLDTLGRCYFANKDIENAIKYQSEALQAEPFSGLMQRQLEQFKKARQGTSKN